MKKTAYLGLFLALALICSYIESLFPGKYAGIKIRFLAADKESNYEKDSILRPVSGTGSDLQLY